MADKVRLKGTKGGLLVVLDDGGDLDNVLRRLEERLLSCGSLFRGAEVTMDLGARNVQSRDLRVLEGIVSRHSGMRLTRVISGGTRAPEDARGATVLRSRPLKSVTQEVSQSDPPEERKEAATLLVRGTVRSGQEVRNEGHVVVFGDVNPGAEVIATGDIIVLGNLRGVAHAGASGDEESIVAAVSLRPTQLRIAGCVGRPPDDEDNPEGAELARVRDGRIVVESYGKMWRGEGGVWGRP